VKITAIRVDRMRLPLDPPFNAAWDPAPRRHFDATLVRVETDDGFDGGEHAAPHRLSTQGRHEGVAGQRRAVCCRRAV